MAHSWLPTVTVLVGGSTAPGAGAKVFPPSVDSNSSPAAVLTVIVSPMAATRATAVPRSATGLHHAGAAFAVAPPITSADIAMSAVATSRIARLRRSEPIQPLDDAELQGDVRHRVDDHRGPQRVGPLHQPAEGEADQEGDRDEGRN